MKSAFLLLLICVSAFAETNVIPAISIDGRAFTNATVRKVNATTAIVRDDSGFGSIAITNLPEPFRSSLFSERDAAEAEKNARLKKDFRNTLNKSIQTALVKSNYVTIEGRMFQKSLLSVTDGTIRSAYKNGAIVNILEPGNTLGKTIDIFVIGITNVADDQFVLFQAKKINTLTHIGGRTLETWDCGTEPKQ